MLRAIALFKFLQAKMLFSVSFAALHLLRPDNTLVVNAWIGALPIDGNAAFVQAVGGWITRLLPHQLAGIGAGAFLYGSLFSLEAVGLWHRRVWAEWLTAVATGLLIPLELYEVTVRLSLLRIAVLFVNVAVVWYLIRQLRRQHPPQRHQAVATR